MFSFIHTAAEDDTSVVVTKNSQKSTLTLSSRVSLDIHLPAEEFIAIQSDKAVMAIQFSAGDCIDVKGYREFCSTGSLRILPSINNAASRYILNPLSHDQQRNMVINMIVRTNQANDVVFNGISLFDHESKMLNLTLNWTYRQFSMYRLHLLACSGKMELGNDRFIILSQTAPFIYAQRELDRSLEGTELGNDKYNQEHNSSSDDSLHTTINASIPSADVKSMTSARTSHSVGSMTSRAVRRRPTATSATVRKSFQTPSQSQPKNVLTYENEPTLDVGRTSPSRQSSGVPFVVKEARNPNEINFPEAEWRSARRQHDDNDPGFDITAIAVMVSLASAIVLVIVVVFGFFIAEFVCSGDKWTVFKASLRFYRTRPNRRKIGDCRPLIADNIEMFPPDYDVEISN